TDDVGTSESNQTLSDNRAKAVKDYLVKQGVAESRLLSTGYGEEKPVADNKTAAGRAKNRRTEMTARNF
ncbi:MAG: OmpA family protein, partial [Chitinophagaceae bacterium]